MQVLKQFIDFYINTSLHVAVAVFSLIQISRISLNIPSNSENDFFIFFATIFGYNFLKYCEVFWNQFYTFKRNFAIVCVSLIAVFEMFFYFLKLEKSIQIEFFKIGFVIVAYPFLRKFGFLKMLLVAFCITYITVYIPEINYKLNWIFMCQRFLIVFCLLIPLEICDLESDSKTIKTLPKIIGIQNLKILGYLLLIFSCFLKLNFVIAIVIALFIFFSDKNKSKYHTSFWLESVPIFWFILLLFTK